MHPGPQSLSAGDTAPAAGVYWGAASRSDGLCSGVHCWGGGGYLSGSPCHAVPPSPSIMIPPIFPDVFSGSGPGPGPGSQGARDSPLRLPSSPWSHATDTGLAGALGLGSSDLEGDGPFQEDPWGDAGRAASARAWDPAGLGIELLD